MAPAGKRHRTANPAMARAMVELRTSGAAGPHGDRRTKRNRERGTRKRAAIRDQLR